MMAATTDIGAEGSESQRRAGPGHMPFWGSSLGVSQRGRGEERPELAVIADVWRPQGDPGQEVSDLNPRIVPGVDCHQPSQR